MKQSSNINNNHFQIPDSLVSATNLNKLQSVAVHDIQFSKAHKKCLPLRPNNERHLKKVIRFNSYHNHTNYPKSLPGLANFSSNTNHQSKDLDKKSNRIGQKKGEKNAKILNTLIDILKTDDPSTEKQSKKSESVTKTIKTQPSYLNEFMEMKPSSTKNYHQPKIIQNEVLRLANHQNIIRRRLRSQQKSRNIVTSKEKERISGFNMRREWKRGICEERQRAQKFIFDIFFKINNMYQEGKKKWDLKFETDIETEKYRNRNEVESGRSDSKQKKEKTEKEDIRNILDGRHRKFLTDEEGEYEPKCLRNYMSDDQTGRESKRVRESSYKQYIRKYVKKNDDQQIKHCSKRIQIKRRRQNKGSYE